MDGSRSAKPGMAKADHVHSQGGSRACLTSRVSHTACRSAWARLIGKVYEVDPPILRHPKGGAFRCLLTIDRPPPGLDPITLN